MKKPILISVMLIGVLIFLSGCGQQTSQQPTCNRPYILVGTSCCLDQNSNNICDKDETNKFENSKPAATSIKINELISFTEQSIKNSFPEAKGTFSRFGEDIEEQIKNGHSCYTGFTKPCTEWLYPSENTKSGEVFSNIFDFGKAEAPSINEVLSEFTPRDGVQKKTLPNGDIILQSYDLQSIDPRVSMNTWMVEVKVPCINQFWVTVGTLDSRSPISQGPFLEVANEILKFCKNKEE